MHDARDDAPTSSTTLDSATGAREVLVLPRRQGPLLTRVNNRTRTGLLFAAGFLMLIRAAVLAASGQLLLAAGVLTLALTLMWLASSHSTR